MPKSLFLFWWVVSIMLIVMDARAGPMHWFDLCDPRTGSMDYTQAGQRVTGQVKLDVYAIVGIVPLQEVECVELLLSGIPSLYVISTADRVLCLKHEWSDC